MSDYTAVAPPTELGGRADEPEEEEEEEPTGPLTTQQRLAALKRKLGDARKQNHKAVVAEDHRNKLGPEALKKQRAERAYQRHKAAGNVPTEEEKKMAITAEAADEQLSKEEKKAKRRGEYGWDVFNNEAQYRHYKKQVRRAGDDGRLDTGADAVAAAAEADPLAYGENDAVPKERVQALVDDMHAAALRRAQWSRRRTFDEAKDVTYINKRNEVYNKKIERAFDPYTAEIRANLERGTAL